MPAVVIFIADAPILVSVVARHFHFGTSLPIRGWGVNPLEYSGHMPMTEEPGKFLISLLQFARPIQLWKSKHGA